jgi:Dolichyl-phosphate-mannose-protein mannosyltransferase
MALLPWCFGLVCFAAVANKDVPMAADTISPAPPRCRRWRALALFLILAAAFLHLAYFLCDCPLDLAPDEAHYWEWSRHLDWSYYSKGPLVAYLIRASCEVYGPWARQWTGNEMPAVRLPAVLCGSLLLVSLYALTLQVYGRDRLAIAVVALALTLPLIAAGSSLMTIDAPYTCCWGWALVLGHRAIFRGSGWAWPAAGLLIGLGILAKYTMVLWVPSLGLFLLTDPARRRLLFRPGFWVMTAAAAACCVPILLWNARHEWVSVRHVGGQAGMDQEAGFSWWGPLRYTATQAGVLLGFWFIVWLRALAAHRPWKEPDAGVRYLWWLSAPVFTVFLLFSVKTGGGQPNWPVTAYLSGIVLATAWLARQMPKAAVAYRRLTAGALAAACGLGLGLTLLMHFSNWVQPVLARIAGPPTAEQPLPLRRFDPTCRLRGWRTLAAEVDRIRTGLKGQGIEPLLAGSGWPVPGELAFYCRGRPTVYCLGLVYGDRCSQYDLWRPNLLWDPGHFAGRTVIVVGDAIPALHHAFAHVDAPRVITHWERAEPVARWTVTVCRGFRGFGPETFRQQGHHY